MPLEIPQIDSRTYRDFVNEALARIPVHNPEYTNFNDADPGVTLLQLFAFMAESVSYRANLIPERNRRAFLRLLGVPLRAAEPARGLVELSNPRGALATTLISADEELLAARVPLRTTGAVEVLPIEARLYYKSRLADERRDEVDQLYRRLYASHQTASTDLDFYETQIFESPRPGSVLPALDLGADTVDGSLWVALLARPGEDPEAARQAIASRVLTLGVVPAVEGTGRVLRPGAAAASDAGAGLVVQVPRVEEDGGAQSGAAQSGAAQSGGAQSGGAQSGRLEVRTEHDLRARPGVAEIVLPTAEELVTWNELEPLESGVGNYPPPLEDSDDGEQLITWLRISAPELGGRLGASSQVSVRLTWVGINAAEVVQQARVVAELLPRGTGEPDQVSRLVNTPVLTGSVRLSVGGEVWQVIDDLMAAAPEVPASTSGASETPRAAKVFTLDRESGEIRFGDGAHGARPPAGAIIQAAYAYGGGRQGMVGIGAITKGAALPAGIKVSNPVPTWGGDEAETIEEAVRRIPRFLRHRDRLVSSDDYLDVVWNTPGVDLGRVEVLPLFHPELEEGLAAGVVTLLVLPRQDAARKDAPRPDQLFLETLCRHLEPRRLITTELFVRGPVYVPIWISLGVEVMPGYDQGPVRQAVEKAIRRFVSPLAGGFEENGWPLRKAVDRLEIAAVATRVEGVSKVGEVLLGDSVGREVETAGIRGLELPRIAGLSVTAGDALSLDELRGVDVSGTGGGSGGSGDDGTDGDGDGTSVVPVPVVPSEC